MLPSEKEITMVLAGAVQALVGKYQNGEFQRGIKRAKLEDQPVLDDLKRKTEDLSKTLQASCDTNEKLESKIKTLEADVASLSEFSKSWRLSDLLIAVQSGQIVIVKSRYTDSGVVDAEGLLQAIRLCAPQSKIPNEINLSPKLSLDELGKTNYESMFTSLGVKPLSIPAWDQCTPEYREAWTAAAGKVVELAEPSDSQ